MPYFTVDVFCKSILIHKVKVLKDFSLQARTALFEACISSKLPIPLPSKHVTSDLSLYAVKVRNIKFTKHTQIY